MRRNGRIRPLTINRVAVTRRVAVALALGVAKQGYAQPAPNPVAVAPNPQPTRPPVTFSPGMLAFPVDVSLFAEGKPVLPGVYRVDLYLNDVWKGKFDVRFEPLTPNDRIAQACFDKAMIALLDVDPDYLNPDRVERLDAGASVCGDVGQIIRGASHRFDVGMQTLFVTAPQRVLMRRARGAVDPARWDAGVTAATLDYRYNGWTNRQLDRSQTSHYLGLRGGVNLGNWRVRYRATFNRRNGAGSQYHGDALYIERALVGMRSRLIVGDTVTDGRVMDGVNLRGVMLSSNERMHPDALSGFVPVIQGIAQSNARVTVHQRGSQIFEMTVPPGPFIIDDLYPNGSGGDLLVTITEADGAQHSFTVAYTSLPELLRPGATRYSVALGETRNRGASRQAKLATAAVSHGINNTVTVYGGFMAAQGYGAMTAGAGLNLPIGAVSVDLTWARTSIRVQGRVQGQGRQRFHGAGLRLAYAKRFNPTETDFTLALARYATQGYVEPGQAFTWMAEARRGERIAPQEQRRSQLSVNVNQPLPGALGSLALSGSVQDYWQRQARDVQYHVSYGRSFGMVSASLAAARSRNTATGRWDNQVMLTLSMPLGSGQNRAHLHSSFTHRPSGKSAQTSVSGSLGEGSPVAYSLYGTVDQRRAAATATSGGASLSWSSPIARMGTSVSASSRGSRQLGFSAAGGVVAFPDGLVLSPELGDTVGVVQARHAQGAGIRSGTGVKLDERGQAVVAHLQPYRENTVELDTRGVSTDVEVRGARQNVVPTEGAVVLLRFETRYGYSALMTGRRQDGSFWPFAAGVFDAQGKNVGYVGQRGQVLVRVDASQGELTVRWGRREDQQCRVAYDLDAQHKAVGDVGDLRRVEAACS